MPSQRIVGHLDMDAFFAAIEERNNPRFQGLPIAVGGDPKSGNGRGVLSTANYRAREYGLHSAMSVKKAWHLSERAKTKGQPPVVFLSGSFNTYGLVSKSIMSIVEYHAPFMQKRSIDEAYFDLSAIGSFKEATKICHAIKQDILRQEQLTASIGLGPNKLIAKIASDFDKPNGFTIIHPESVMPFLASLPIRSIPGIGPKTADKLYQNSVQTVADLQKISQQQLEALFGKWGTALHQKARGIDHSPLSEGRIAKSIGRHRTFFQDTLESSYIVNELNKACEDIHNRLINEGFTQYRTVVLTIRFHDFQTQTRSHTLPEPTSSLPKLKHELLRLLLPFLDNRSNPAHKKIRLIGARLEKIV